MNPTVQAAINSIRAIDGLYAEDIQALVAALSCKIATDANKHLPGHQAAIDVLDDLSNFIADGIADQSEALCHYFGDVQGQLDALTVRRVG